MTPEQIDRVFGCGRLQMATGEHVEVFREAVAPGERRRYTKRFLATRDGDFGQWTEREWRILARLIGHGIRCVPDVVQFDGGAKGGLRLVQTYDAGVTVDQWATLLPVARDAATHRHIFEDCAHWWALAHHCLAAFNEIHALGLVHLDIKADNICIPYGPADFDPDSSGPRIYPTFARLALIDFAFSLVSRESLATPLPIGWQKDYDYQSPRLLRALEAGRNGDLEPTKELDWRCDFYSLAAMLKRYLPADSRAHAEGDENGWTSRRYDDARSLIFRLRDSHDRDLPHWRPHQQLMDFTGARLEEPDLAASLDRGWMLARDAIAGGTATPITPITPITRIARSLRAATITPLTRIAPSEPGAAVTPARSITSSRVAVDRARIVPRVVVPTAVTTVPGVVRTRVAKQGVQAAKALVLTFAALIAVAAPSFIGDRDSPLIDRARDALAALRSDFRAQWNAALSAASAPAPIPARAGTQDPSAASEDRFATPGQEPAVAAASTHAQDASTATSSSGQGSNAGTLPLAENQVATAAIPAKDASASTPAQESVPATSTGAQGQGGPPSTQVPAPANAVGPAPVATNGGSGSGARLPTVPTPSSVTPPSPNARARPGAPTNQSQAGKRSPPSASASTGKPLRGPATAVASGPGRSTSRQVLSRSTPVNSLPPPVRVAAATVTPSSALPTTPGPSIAPVASGAPVDQQAAQSGATQNPSIATESASAANEDGRVSAPPTPTQSSEVGSPPPDQRSLQPTAKQPRGATKPQPRDEWHTLLDTIVGALRNRDGPPAPVEERSVKSSPTPRQGATPARSAPEVLAQTAPATLATTRAQGVAAARPAAAATDAAAAAPIPAAAPVQLTIEPFVEANPAPSAALAAPGVEQRAQSRPAPAAQPSASLAEVRAPVAVPSISAPARVAAPPAPEAARERPTDSGHDAWATQARRVLSETVPRVAAQAEPDVSRVLWAAARANQPYQIRAVVDAASATWASETAWIPVNNVAPGYARLLHNDARQALAAGRDVSDAVNFELQAFGANPRDADIAGYLAFLHLRMKPAQPETARQLALLAIAISGSRRSTRSDDWGTLAVASALTGRETDAARAFLTEVALSSNIDRSCYSALSAYASFGERLRVPVQAMLYRVQSLGRGYAYPSCAWPSAWSVAARSPGGY